MKYLYEIKNFLNFFVFLLLFLPFLLFPLFLLDLPPRQQGVSLPRRKPRWRGGILYGVGMVKRVNYETKNNVMLYGVGNMCMWGWQEGCESMQLVPSNGVLFIIIIKINRIFMIIYTNLIKKL